MPTKLGQNFLQDKNIVKKIIKSAGLKPDDLVIEVGPGNGILTKELAKNVKKIIAIEVDKNLAERLKEKFKNQLNTEIINADILKVNLETLLSKFKKYKVVANLPYYITSPIIRLFLESVTPPQEMVLMVQKEVAERITAKPGQMSILALAVQYYAKPKLLFEVKKEAFLPVPKVDSAIIKITLDSHILNKNKEYTKRFFRLIRAGFCAKRKTLANNITNSLHLDKKNIEEGLKKTKLHLSVRAQELSLSDWKKLLDIL